MPTRKPLLIVPIRDRRQHRRILTIRNSAISIGVVVAIFAAFSIYNETRHVPAGQYGRLAVSRVPAPSAVAPRNEDVIDEGAVTYQRPADAILIVPPAREQVPQATRYVPVPAPPPSGFSTAPAQVASDVQGRTIVGDKGGVAVVQATTARPVLAGGIFKQQ